MIELSHIDVVLCLEKGYAVVPLLGCFKGKKKFMVDVTYAGVKVAEVRYMYSDVWTQKSKIIMCV